MMRICRFIAYFLAAAGATCQAASADPRVPQAFDRDRLNDCEEMFRHGGGGAGIVCVSKVSIVLNDEMHRFFAMLNDIDAERDRHWLVCNGDGLKEYFVSLRLALEGLDDADSVMRRWALQNPESIGPTARNMVADLAESFGEMETLLGQMKRDLDPLRQRARGCDGGYVGDWSAGRPDGPSTVSLAEGGVARNTWDGAPHNDGFWRCSGPGIEIFWCTPGRLFHDTLELDDEGKLFGTNGRGGSVTLHPK